MGRVALIDIGGQECVRRLLAEGDRVRRLRVSVGPGNRLSNTDRTLVGLEAGNENTTTEVLEDIADTGCNLCDTATDRPLVGYQVNHSGQAVRREQAEACLVQALLVCHRLQPGAH